MEIFVVTFRKISTFALYAQTFSSANCVWQIENC